MKGLAEFVMRGRWQALLVVVAGAGSLLFCWISAAVIALITLRKGAGAGVWLFFWSLLPAGTLWYSMSDSGPLTLLAGTTVIALVLRATVNLPLAVLVSVLVGIGSAIALLVFAGAYLDQVVAYFGEFLSSVEQKMVQGKQALELPRPGVRQVAGMLGAGTAMLSVLCLLLGRYWQAALYNPGGFGVEFRALYYPISVALPLVIAALALSGLGVEYRSWAMIFFIPLTFVGLALVHARVAMRGQGAGWLGWFYAAWVIFDPVKLLLVFFAIADSWLQFRRRWAPQSTTDLDQPARRHDDSDDQNDN